MPHSRLPWPIVWDAFLTALVLQGILAVSGHFIGFLGRHYSITSAVASAILGFIFGVWANPTPALLAGLGGALVTGGSALAGAALVFFLGDAKPGALMWVVMTAAAIGLVTGAIGSMVGRSVFGS
jgi:hypothetical protein